MIYTCCTLTIPTDVLRDISTQYLFVQLVILNQKYKQIMICWFVYKQYTLYFSLLYHLSNCQKNDNTVLPDQQLLNSLTTSI